MGVIELDLLGEQHFSLEECGVFLNGFIAAFQSALYDKEHFVDKHANENIKDVHLLHIHAGALQIFIRRILPPVRSSVAW